MSWIFYTIAATILQTFRNLEQKALNKKLDSLTVSWSRFILPLPFAILVFSYTLQSVTTDFAFYCLVTAIAQVGGNICLLQAFKSKNFSIGIAFYKTEVLQTMLIGLLFFGQTVSFVGLVAIFITTIGVIAMSGSVFNSGLKKFLKSLNDRSAFFGLLCGFFFSISGFSLKLGSQALLDLGYSAIKAPLMVLMWVILFQNILFFIVKFYQKRLMKDLNSLFNSENKFIFLKTTILSFAGSVCWFTAFSVGKVIDIKVVGQLELILAIIVSHFILKEKLNRIQALGIALTAVGILVLILTSEQGLQSSLLNFHLH